MSEPRFKIVFSGELMPGASLEAVKANLARLFKSDLSKIEHLFGGSSVTLKRELGEAEADKYLAALRQAGALVHKQADLAASLSLVATDDHPDATGTPAAPTPDTDARMHCPKCGHEQARAAECAACGIIIEKFLARQAQLGESAVPAAPTPPVVEAAPPVSPYAPPQAEVGDSLPEYGELNVFGIDGRIGRLRYLAWSLCLGLAAIPAALLIGGAYALLPVLAYTLGAVTIIAMLLLSIRMSVQRLHDIGWSGWLCLLNLVPYLGSVFTLVMMIVPGTAAANRFGAPPPPNSRAVKVLAGLWLLVPVAGILAAIAIPAYQDYLLRAQQ